MNASAMHRDRLTRLYAAIIHHGKSQLNCSRRQTNQSDLFVVHKHERLRCLRIRSHDRPSWSSERDRAQRQEHTESPERAIASNRRNVNHLSGPSTTTNRISWVSNPSARP